jgi:hypothetical protein
VRPQAIGPASFRFVQPRALGRKASDEFTVPLCRTHHRAVHSAGDERTWWKQTSIDPMKIARKRPLLADALSAPGCGVSYFELKIPRD